MTGALDAVLNLRPVYYDWRADSPAGLMHSKNNATAPLPREVGFLAQEVREALPREGEGVVGEVDEAGHLGLSYSKLTAVLVGAMQEQQAASEAAMQEQHAVNDAQQATMQEQQATMQAQQVVNDAQQAAMQEQQAEISELRLATQQLAEQLQQLLAAANRG